MKNLKRNLCIAVMAWFMVAMLALAGCGGNGTASIDDDADSNGRAVEERSPDEVDTLPGGDSEGVGIGEIPEYITVGGVEVSTLTRNLSLTHNPTDGPSMSNITQEEFENFRYLLHLESLSIGFSFLGDSTSPLDIPFVLNNTINDLSPLAELPNLRQIGLQVGDLSDLSPIANMTNLEALALEGGRISDLTPLSGLTNLVTLVLRGSRMESDLAWRRHEFVGGEISDLSPIAGLTNLVDLNLSGNRIVDISPLANLANLERIILNDNDILSVEPFVGVFPNLRNLQLVNNAFCGCGAALYNIRDIENQWLSIQPGPHDRCDFIVGAEFSTWMLADMAQEPIIGFVGFSTFIEPGTDVPELVWLGLAGGRVFTLDGTDIVTNFAGSVRFSVMGFGCVLEVGGRLSGAFEFETGWGMSTSDIGSNFEILDSDRIVLTGGRGDGVEFVRQE